MTANLKALVQKIDTQLSDSEVSGDTYALTLADWNLLRPVIGRMESERQDGARTAETPETGALKMSKWVPTTDLMMLRRMGKLIEEMNELGTVAARCIIQGIDEIDPGTNKVNRERLWTEIADVYAQLDETVQRLGLDSTAIESRRTHKRQLMREWEAMFSPEDKWEKQRKEYDGIHPCYD